MDISAIFSAISTYGLAIVISGLVLFFAIKFINVVYRAFEAKHGVKTHDELATHRNKVSAIITNLLDRAALKIHADRVYVFEFHNGSLSMGGLPFLKMTNTYEALAPGAKSELHKREGMPFQLFHTFVDAIYAEDWLCLDVDDREKKYQPLVYSILEERNVKITIRCKITDLQRRVIGYLGIDYCNGTEVTREKAESYVGEMLSIATELGALLSVNSKD